MPPRILRIRHTVDDLAIYRIIDLLDLLAERTDDLMLTHDIVVLYDFRAWMQFEARAMFATELYCEYSEGANERSNEEMRQAWKS